MERRTNSFLSQVDQRHRGNCAGILGTVEVQDY